MGGFASAFFYLHFLNCSNCESFEFSIQESFEDVEDVSEEACVARHDRSELDERRKFMSYLKQPAGVTRGRRRVDQIDRLDSRADQSSGANTPDPMSPSQAGSKVADGPIMDVDLPAEEGEQRCADPATDGSFTASAIKERRRTASLTKRDSSVWKFVNDDNSGMSWDMDEVSLNWRLLFRKDGLSLSYFQIVSHGCSVRTAPVPSTGHGLRPVSGRDATGRGGRRVGGSRNAFQQARNSFLRMRRILWRCAGHSCLWSDADNDDNIVCRRRSRDIYIGIDEFTWR